MATTDGTDARKIAGAIALSALALPLLGLTALPAGELTLTGSALIPPLLAAGGFLLMMLVVDPVLTPKTRPNRDQVHVWLSKTVMARQPIVEMPVLVGLVIALAEGHRDVLLTGALSTLVLAVLWWPGEQFFGVMRRRLQPLSADRLLDDVLNTTDGHLVLRSR